VAVSNDGLQYRFVIPGTSIAEIRLLLLDGRTMGGAPGRGGVLPNKKEGRAGGLLGTCSTGWNAESW
jgi:hypothetical protein